MGQRWQFPLQNSTSKRFDNKVLNSRKSTRTSTCVRVKPWSRKGRTLILELCPAKRLRFKWIKDQNCVPKTYHWWEWTLYKLRKSLDNSISNLSFKIQWRSCTLHDTPYNKVSNFILFLFYTNQNITHLKNTIDLHNIDDLLQ